MGALHFQAVVGSDHKIEIALPASVPPGPVEVVVNVPDRRSELTDAQRREARKQWLEEMAKFGEQFKGRNINLSQAVIDNRREEKY